MLLVPSQGEVVLWGGSEVKMDTPGRQAGRQKPAVHLCLQLPDSSSFRFFS